MQATDVPTHLANESRRALSSTLYDQRACPLCSDPRIASHLKVVSKPKAESLRFEELKPYWHGFFKEKAFFSYYRCEGCGTLYCRDFFTKDQLDQLYHQMPDNTAGVPVEALRKTQEGYFRLLKQYSTLRGDYLEVGPDIGLFTDFCVKEGAFERYWLFEPNTAVRNSLETLLKGKTWQIFPEFLNFNRLPDRRITTVSMIHVLDHLTDPKSLLLEMKKKLAPGAVLLFVTHDESSLLAKMTKSKWPPYCLQHPLLFNPGTITKLLESAGYKVLSIKKSSNYYPVTYLAKHLFWAAGLKKIPLPSWNSFALPFKLGNIMTVAQAPSAS